MAEVIRMPRLSDTMTEGVIQSWQKNEGDPDKIGDVHAEVETPQAKAEQKPAPAPQPAETDEGRVKASPLAKRLAQEKGIPLDQLKGTGDNGRIVRRDVEEFVETAPRAVPQYTPAGEEGYEDVSLSQMRKTIARRLVESKFSAPHFYLT